MEFAHSKAIGNFLERGLAPGMTAYKGYGTRDRRILSALIFNRITHFDAPHAAAEMPKQIRN